MSFASAYIEKNVLFPQLIIDEMPDANTGIIVVIPSYGEPDINRVIDSLMQAEKPECNVEVIVVVNAPQNASLCSLEINKNTLKYIENRKRTDKNIWFRLFALDIKPEAIQGWGVGLARKTGMDEALRRFCTINNQFGIIVSLDADCRVEKNYFTAICNQFYKNKNLNACSIYFEHDITGNEFSESEYKNILQYELHLRYFLQGLKFAGCPWAFHTVGSAMAVRAKRYVLQGGMNRRQAGEDFYFIQKMISAGGYFSLNTTTVYPSSRTSFRAPFGTGAAMAKLCENSQLMTYNRAAFADLRLLFGMSDLLYNCADNKYNLLPDSVKSYIDKNEWELKITEIRGNTANAAAFKKRFYNWFNMFRTVRFLNTVHHKLFAKVAVVEAAADFLQNIPAAYNGSSPEDLLTSYRGLEKRN
jgi:hypothetical protein